MPFHQRKVIGEKKKRQFDFTVVPRLKLRTRIYKHKQTEVYLLSPNIILKVTSDSAQKEFINFALRHSKVKCFPKIYNIIKEDEIWYIFMERLYKVEQPNIGGLPFFLNATHNVRFSDEIYNFDHKRGTFISGMVLQSNEDKYIKIPILKERRKAFLDFGGKNTALLCTMLFELERYLRENKLPYILDGNPDNLMQRKNGDFVMIDGFFRPEKGLSSTLDAIHT